MISPIIEEARELYYSAVVWPDKLSHIWDEESPNHQDLKKIIETAETPTMVRGMLEKTDMYAIRVSDLETFDLMMKWYVKKMKFILPEYINTPNLCKIYSYCFNICEHISKEIPAINTVLELGGGNGQMALVLKNLFGIKTHIDIDIVESLFMSYVCTREKFPEARCLWMNFDMDDFNVYDYDFIFCPTNMSHRFKNKEFDLFINTASMGEMNNHTIRKWMNFVQREVNVKYFYGLNRFLNTIEYRNPNTYSINRIEENEASVLFDDRWNILHWEIEPLHCRCPYEDPKVARYLEIIAKRIPERDDDPGLMPEICLEDWWRYRDIDILGTRRSNQLVHDLTINGTLFQLWNTIRITPSKGAIDMMLTYLHWINQSNLMFEEETYYLELKESLP